VLFSNAELASFIQRGFEPAWEMVRPAPLVRIDFGNGTVVTRTLHGNIATVVCTAEGKVLDVLPGLYDPAAYRDRLRRFRLLAEAVKARGDTGEKWLRNYHQASAAALKENKVPPPDVAGAGLGFGGGFGGIQGGMLGAAAPGPAGAGGFGGLPRGFGFKGGIEMPLKGALGAKPPSSAQVAGADRGAAGVAAEAPAALGSGEDRSLWKRLEGDTRLNEKLRRRQIHELLAGTGLVNPEAITKRIYREVLRVDLNDPYLGLSSLLFDNYPFAAEDHGF
jgi:hypothetical protein